MNDDPLSLWREDDDMADTNSLLVAEAFGGHFIVLNTKNGRVKMEYEGGLTTAEDRDDATQWVVEHLRAIRLKADPLEVRDMLWKGRNKEGLA